MNIEFRKAVPADAEVLVDIYNAAFYSDFVRYGECPAYGRTKEMMEQSILDFPKHLILCDGIHSPGQSTELIAETSVHLIQETGDNAVNPVDLIACGADDKTIH